MSIHNQQNMFRYVKTEINDYNLVLASIKTFFLIFLVTFFY